MPASRTTIRRGVSDVAQAAQGVLRQHAAAADRAATFPVDSMRAIREFGLLGLLVPEQFGGLGGDVEELVEVSQVLAAGCLSTAMIWAMHCQQVDALVRHATPKLQEELLPRVARGEVYLASVTTEPGKGGHLLTAGASLRESGDLLMVARDAPIVSGGEYADGFLITMRAAEQAPDNQVSLVYADRAQLQLETRGQWDPLGMRATCSVGIRLQGAVPTHHLVGEPGEFRKVATESMIVAGHLGWAACWLGAARSALSDVVGLLRTPERPRSLDPRSELTAERLARARMDIELVGAYLHRVRDEVSSHRAEGRSVDTPAVQIHLNTLKVASAELTFRAVDRLVQLAGLATGYLRTSTIPLERHFRDLRSASLNYSNDRLLTATGSLAMLDRSVRPA
jgi:acyl-CoA dehydrogenase